MTRARKSAPPAASLVSSAATTDDIVQVKVWLLGVSPMVWRDAMPDPLIKSGIVKWLRVFGEI